MKNGLFDIGIVSFVFAPLAVTVTLSLGLLRRRIKGIRDTHPGGFGCTHRSPVCGMLAVAAPPLGLPFIYCAAVIAEAIADSPFTQSSSWSNPDAVIEVWKIIVKLTLLCLIAGLPLGLAGLLRRERMRWLSALGMISSLCVIGYFMIVMSFFAGGPNGD